MNKDLTVGEPSHVLWQFCLPMFGSILFQQLYNIADSLVAGKLIGEHALAAVGNSYEVTLIFIAFSFGCNIGSSVVVSRYFGAKQYHEMKTAISTALIGTGVLCTALMAFGFAGFGAGVKLLGVICLSFTALYLLAGRQMMLLFMNSPTGEAIDTGVVFLRTVAPFYVLLAVKLSSDGLLRGCGRMGRFMVTTLSDLFLRVSLAVMFARMFGIGGIWWAWPVGWSVGTWLSVVFYRTSICTQNDKTLAL